LQGGSEEIENVKVYRQTDGKAVRRTNRIAYLSSDELKMGMGMALVDLEGGDPKYPPFFLQKASNTPNLVPKSQCQRYVKNLTLPKSNGLIMPLSD
jgi:hypothetical protein